MRHEPDAVCVPAIPTSDGSREQTAHERDGRAGVTGPPGEAVRALSGPLPTAGSVLSPGMTVAEPVCPQLALELRDHGWWTSKRKRAGHGLQVPWPCAWRSGRVLVPLPTRLPGHAPDTLHHLLRFRHRHRCRHRTDRCRQQSLSAKEEAAPSIATAA